MKRLLPRPTYANVMASIAVFVALGGASYAATQLLGQSLGAGVTVALFRAVGRASEAEPTQRDGRLLANRRSNSRRVGASPRGALSVLRGVVPRRRA